MNLLIVDDQEPVGAIVGRLAQQLGWNSHYMMTPDGVASAIKTERIDLLLTDFALDGDPRSENTGVKLVESLRRKNISVLAALMTGWPAQVSEPDCQRLEIFRVLAKPLSITELRHTLEEAGRRIRHAREH